MEQANAKIQSLIREKTEEWNNTMIHLEEFKAEVIAELEENILQLSFDIAEKIVNIQLQKDDILFVDIVKRAIETLNAKEKFSLRLNETQFAKYFKDGWAWLADEVQCAPFAIIKDPCVKPYGCIAESEDGIVYAGIEDQLGKLSEVFGRDEGQKDELL
jgi:flagellar assembly protein FliH